MSSEKKGWSKLQLHLRKQLELDSELYFGAECQERSEKEKKKDKLGRPEVEKLSLTTTTQMLYTNRAIKRTSDLKGNAI